MGMVVVIFYIACCVMSAGIINASLRGDHPHLQSEYEQKQNLGMAVCWSLFGPVTLLPVFFFSGFAHYGWSLKYSARAVSAGEYLASQESKRLRSRH